MESGSPIIIIDDVQFSPMFLC